MRFRIRHADQVVGVFILLALAVVVAALVFIGVNERWFAHASVYHSRFASAQSIAVGTPIYLRGFEIGKVTRLGLGDDDLVDLEFTVYEEFLPKVSVNSVLELATSPIGLGTSLLFHRGKTSVQLAEGQLVPAIDSEAGKALVQANLVDIPRKDDTIARLLSGVNTLLENVNATVLLLNATLEGKQDGPVAEVLDNMNATLVGATKAMDSFNGTMGWVQESFGPVATSATGTLDSLNADLPEMFAQIDGIMAQVSATLANLQTMTDSLKDTEGMVPRLLGDPKLMANIEAVITNLNTAMGQVQTILAGLNDEVPKLSGILTEAKSAIVSAQDVMEGLKNNPLLKGGITEKPEQQALFQSLRKEEF